MPTKARLTRAECSTLLTTPSLQVVFNSLGTLKFVKTVSNKGISIITGSKQQKKAVIRNKLRRRLYTLFCQFYNNSEKTPVIAMLYVSKHSYTFTYDVLEKEFNALLTKAQKNT
jgi:ribonuclease P protein component